MPQTESQNPRDYIRAQIKAELKTTASQSVSYVAFGKLMKQDLMKRYGMTPAEAESELAKIAADLMDKIKEL